MWADSWDKRECRGFLITNARTAIDTMMTRLVGDLNLLLIGNETSGRCSRILKCAHSQLERAERSTCRNPGRAVGGVIHVHLHHRVL